MNIGQLKAVIDAAMERGLDPETTVVIDMMTLTNPHEAVWPILGAVHDPTIDEDGYIWFTLEASETEADFHLHP